MWALLVLFLFLAGASTVAAVPADAEWDFISDLQVMPSCERASLPAKTLSQPTDVPSSSEIDVFSALYCVLAGN